jgi:hypothetical protein
MKKVVIVGAGSAGLFAAYKLAQAGYDVTLIDKGRAVEERKCPSYSRKSDCAHCVPCNTIYGIGGAGLKSDGKLIFHTRTGNNLTELIGEEKNQELVNEVEEIFKKYGVNAEIPNQEKRSRLMTIASQAGIEYVPSKEAHIGSDRLPSVIEKIVNDISGKVEIITEKEANFVHGELVVGATRYSADSYVLATGRAGSSWLEKITDELKLEYSFNPVDIGVRVEVQKELMDDVCSVSWDFKARMTTRKYEDPIRTFCVCPGGYVAREEHNGFCLVNGHSLAEQKSENTNFAFLVTYKLTEPLKNGDLYGKEIARKATFVGGGKPIIQRLGDLRRGRRSTWERINKYHKPVPTLTQVTPGDIGSALEYRFVIDVLEGLEKLDKLIPGVANDATLLYCPEIKLHGVRFKTDSYLQTNKKGLYIAGDGSGWSRGIVGAACCGLLAAEGIMKNGG